jgi:hypothetical protein
MLRTLLLASLVLLTGCASSFRSLWRDWGNTDLAGRTAPALSDGAWLLPPDDDDGARDAPDAWVPPDARWRLVVFLQPH